MDLFLDPNFSPLVHIFILSQCISDFLSESYLKFLLNKLDIEYSCVTVVFIYSNMIADIAAFIS